MRLLLCSLTLSWLLAPVLPAWADAPVGPAEAASPASTILAPQAAAITGWRFEESDATAVLNVSVSQAASYQERADANGWSLFLRGTQPGLTPPLTSDTVLGDVAVQSQLGGCELSLPWKYWCPTDIQPNDSQTGLVITFHKIYDQAFTEQLAPGIIHTRRRQADGSGPLDIQILSVDPRVPGVKVFPALAGDGTGFTREPVSAIARRYGAIAAINGAYFSFQTNAPVGLLMLDGQVVSAPYQNRSALVIDQAGHFHVATTELSEVLALPNGSSYAFDGVNQARGLNRVVLFTKNFGATTGTAPGGCEYSVAPNGQITAILASNSPIPPDGYVISAQGQPADWLSSVLKVGSFVGLKSPLKAFWPGVAQALGAGPLLVHEGQIDVTGQEEGFKPDITQGTAPRSAVGLLPDGRMLLVTVDGRVPRISRGMSLNELAALLQKLGATEALNLDGGGSTAMVIDGAVVNHPSDGQERAVSDALIITTRGAGMGMSKALSGFQSMNKPSNTP